MQMNDPHIIVVGGGLSGLSAAHTVLERGGRVLLLDKNTFLGGNSTKATSGINGAGTSTQRALKKEDSPELFYQDTAQSARELIHPDLVQVLTWNSASAVEWLKKRFGLDLSLVSRLGGHSAERTHRGKERFPGMTITYALMQKLEEISEKHPDQVKIMVRACVRTLIGEHGGKVVGVEYVDLRDQKIHKAFGPVILATGGYAADFSETSLIKKYRPELYNLPTTNGDYSTGDGHKMVMKFGGNALNLEKIQVHPTGLVNPSEPNAKVLFLAAEALRGVGGLLLTNDGKRFCDELGHRDYVTGKMWENNKAPYRLVLNGVACKEIEWHCKHYKGRGLMKQFNSGKELAIEMGISPSALEETFNDYNQCSITKKCRFGKKYFSNAPFKMNDTFHVAIVTPVLHYTMGGVHINASGEIQGPQGSIPGLYASGELAGGVHGANRLGGSSLLGCVVFGRVAGDSASKYLLSQLSQNGISRSNDKINLQLNPSQNSVTVSWGTATHSSSETAQESENNNNNNNTTTTTTKAVTKDTNKELKEFTYEEVSSHNNENDCWIVVNGQVLDVTKFLPDHPGGKKAVLLYAGKDATEEFMMMHKLDVIPRYAPDTVIGKIKGLKAKL